MQDIQVRPIELNDEQKVQRCESKEKIRMNWEHVPTIGFAGFVLSIALYILAHYMWDADGGMLTTMFVGSLIGAALGVYSEYRRLKLMPGEEKRWHTDYIALCGEVEKFSERLEAFRRLALTLDSTQEIDRTLIGRYLAERDSLSERMRVFRRDMALKRYEEAVSKNTDGRFRDTRDVTEQVFVNRVRVAKAEAEIRVLTQMEDSPNEAEFKRLEQRFNDEDDDAEPAESAARRVQ